MFLSSIIKTQRTSHVLLQQLHRFNVLKFMPINLSGSVWCTSSAANSTDTMGSSSSKSLKISKKKGKMSPTDEFVEEIVCQDSDIKENEMKSFDLGDAGKVLLVRQNGKLSALGAKCTHYGAPLNTGVLGDGRVRCPWHGACFNITTGDIEDFPGLDSLPCFQVEVEDGGGVKVRAKKNEVQSSKRTKIMVARDKKETTTFVIIGGGPAGLCCAETLRQEGFIGRIVMVCKEPFLPYDRVKVSKAMDVTPDKIILRPAAFYKENGIEILTNTELASINAESKSLKLSSGNDLKYDSLFLATGSTPRRPPTPGVELKNVFVLYTIDVANNFVKLLGPDKNVVILGSSFIGMEAASYCIDKVKSVTVIGRDEVPFLPVLGKDIGARMLALFLEKGVAFKMNSGVARFLASSPEGDTVSQVELLDGSRIPADICVVGIGSLPSTRYLDGSGVNVDQRGAVIVNKYLESNLEGIYAGGDIAYAPVLDTTAAIGHWQLAHYHGRIAALNMVGKQTELKAVPFFWTMLFGKGIRYAGYAPNYEEIIIGGSVEDLKFVAHYIIGDRVAAVATVGKDPVAAKFAEMLALGKTVLKTDLEPDPLAWTEAELL